MTKSKRRKRSASQTLLWLLSLFLIASMTVSLVIWALPGATSPAQPTFTPIPPTLTPTPTQPPATPSPTPPLLGPELPTETPTS